MEQIYIPYWEWEDWINGMWKIISNKEYESILIQDAIKFTGNHIEYGKAMLEVIFAWPMTMTNSLTNNSINQKAFVGHCACCFKFGWPEYIVRIAWGNLNEDQRDLANNEAQKAIELWQANYIK